MKIQCYNILLLIFSSPKITHTSHLTCLIGAFIVTRNYSSRPANVMNSDEGSDLFWEPNVRSTYSAKVQYINDTLFVYGLYAPFHFSHWMFNGLLPLYR